MKRAEEHHFAFEATRKLTTFVDAYQCRTNVFSDTLGSRTVKDSIFKEAF